jgi:polyisoprenoid-binding protein YceI
LSLITWNIDSAHTEVNFSVRHMMISNVRDQFQTFSGTIDFDETNPVNTTVAVENAASIAAMILTTDALVTDVPEKNPAPMMPSGGGEY